MIDSARRDTNGITSTGLRFGLYDWASSPLSALHATFIFPVYFATAVMPEGGSAAWASMNAAAALVIALAAPFIGILGDRHAVRKRVLGLATMVASLAVMALWFVEPVPSDAAMALILSGLVIVASELAFVVYNALLPRVAGPDTVGRVSGIAWGLGYFGAIACLGLMLALFVLPEAAPFGLDKGAAEHIRVTMPLAGLWFILFALPFFLLVPEAGKVERRFWPMLVEGWHAVSKTPKLLRFLLARMLYADALVTLFAMGGIFAAKVHGFNQTDVLVFAVILNVTAGVGAFVGGRADDRYGSLPTLRGSLVLMILIGSAAIAASSPMLFWVSGSMLGLMVGTLQSSSRSLVARLAPKGAETRVFGFMMLTGKATAFLGPLLYGILVTMTDSDRVGMTVVVALLAAGLLLLPPGNPRGNPGGES